MENIKEVYEFYNNGAEIDRLEKGLGKIEFYRTKEILSQYINDNSVIYDIGGGIGKYSQWLAKNNDVTLIELAPNAVEFAKKTMDTNCLYKAEIGDARKIEKPDESADIVLLMGPLYHLQKQSERNRVLSEAYRVLKKGGLLFAVGISKFSSTTWALSVYGNGNNFIDDDIYLNMLKKELETGKHIRPKEYSFFIANAYFHTIDSLTNEVSSNGFEIINQHAIESCIWISPALDEKWENEESRKRLLDIIHATEHEKTLMGISPHFMVVAKK
ncbi:MAG: class I SAM-dependent methyltransferase [Ruminococcus sp.]|nr:class I SAM-dependent methyltransferase [Ruminococcus sp.]